MSVKNSLTNMDRATVAWGQDMPAWVRLLAGAADSTNQRQAAEKIGRNASYVSRIINRDYAGSYEEAERLVRAAWGNEDVVCPVWHESIPLRSCMNLRRRKGLPRNLAEQLYYKACPSCPNNTDVATDGQATEAASCAA
ncbi:hypothetical protein IP68_04805 [Blastomonas sp. AAP25]|uniref:helix-turn-helix domain-containing protein n=1 Tax=Blastomonas sp. AAP25 TaxID=1523416 RepID=UPI0006CC38E3|nr:helix-turn-helix transcriptional regulator [Blastomonas sp. AAP25]KPF75858.1 hypothetical protein IP68_04805 [Blastomonas sp. AAP25]